MNKCCLALILTVILIISTSSEALKSEKECKGTREFWGCESKTKDCHRLCANKNLRKTTDCSSACELSCVCEAGFLRESKDGNCIPEAECPKA